MNTTMLDVPLAPLVHDGRLTSSRQSGRDKVAGYGHMRAFSGDVRESSLLRGDPKAWRPVGKYFAVRKS